MLPRLCRRHPPRLRHQPGLDRGGVAGHEPVSDGLNVRGMAELAVAALPVGTLRQCPTAHSRSSLQIIVRLRRVAAPHAPEPATPQRARQTALWTLWVYRPR